MVFNIRLVQSGTIEVANSLPVTSDTLRSIGEGDARVSQSFIVEVRAVGIDTRNLNSERVRVLLEFASVEEDNVESLVGGLGEDIEVPKVSRLSRSRRQHLEAIEVASDREVLDGDRAIVILRGELEGSSSVVDGSYERAAGHGGRRKKFVDAHDGGRIIM